MDPTEPRNDAKVWLLLPTPMKTDLEQLGQQDRRPVNFLIREAITEYLSRRDQETAK
ncbi:hypothetical protein [Micromonospora sp. LH3U1]|uniref:hypothetical protein n=1 Tax=Micromonospora sp. LH3U1 TaxID=3018339 RepID=UPI002349628E|nr:hypothetical protein [Micromonospora sp. LH3U1]WCN80033.1 hypothetical protein PCA76_24200 [Micromonospora sp. LH3U1]